MIQINESIIVKSDINKVWAFLTDFSHSMVFNRFHKKIELPDEYSIKTIENFKIIHNFGFGNYSMNVKILDCIPPNYIKVYEYFEKDTKKGFPHYTTYILEHQFDRCLIKYSVKGTYGSKVQDISFKPILKGVTLEELIKLKKAIESSERSAQGLTSKSYKPI
tara:strand:+ start:1794 stop:2282 length:489 start_codon:yes stop_codon:yes gene_type:complete